MIEPLTSEMVISGSGWPAAHARVLVIQEVGDGAIVLVDGNGDGAEVEQEQWFFTEEGWAAGSSGGVGSFDGRPLWTWGSIGSSGYVVGCADPGQSVAVEWMDMTQRAIANDLGIWVCHFPDPPSSRRTTEVPNNSIRVKSPQDSGVLLDRPRVTGFT